MQKVLEKPAKASRPQMEIVTITPEIAAAWLDQNTHNRKYSAQIVGRYARDMTSGEFKFTGDPIRFDINKRLIDGQHRLMACVKAGVPFESLVIYSLPSSTQSLMDMGKSRKASDVLALNGIHYTNQVAGACRLVLMEKFDHAATKGGSWSTAEILAVADKHPAIHVSIRRVMAARTPPGVPRIMLCYIHMVASSLLDMPDRADAFVDVFQSGVPDYTNDPAHALRERLLQGPGSKAVLKPTETFKAMKHAWNLFATKQKVKTFKWPKDVAIEGLNLKKL